MEVGSWGSSSFDKNFCDPQVLKHNCVQVLTLAEQTSRFCNSLAYRRCMHSSVITPSDPYNIKFLSHPFCSAEKYSNSFFFPFAELVYHQTQKDLGTMFLLRIIYTQRLLCVLSTHWHSNRTGSGTKSAAP